MNAFPLDPSYCDSDHSQPALGSSPSTAQIADPPTLLVVDDDPFFRELEARALCSQGYKVLQANGTAEALRLAGATPAIHLLVTDFIMPGDDGLELTRQFRTLHPKTPVVMLSGSLPLVQGKVGGLERFALLEKSSTFEALLGKVHALLNELSPLPLRTGCSSMIGLESPVPKDP
jgi:DNA-binding response OmpR family regulator